MLITTTPAAISINFSSYDAEKISARFGLDNAENIEIGLDHDGNVIDVDGESYINSDAGFSRICEVIEEFCYMQTRFPVLAPRAVISFEEMMEYLQTRYERSI